MTVTEVISVWAAYETARFVASLVLRDQIARFANTNSTCRRCRFRLFSVKAGYFLQSKLKRLGPRAQLTILFLSLALGNGDAVFYLVQRLVDQKRRQHAQRPQENNVS